MKKKNIGRKNKSDKTHHYEPDLVSRRISVQEISSATRTLSLDLVSGLQ